jgi:hypothetical protein
LRSGEYVEKRDACRSCRRYCRGRRLAVAAVGREVAREEGWRIAARDGRTALELAIETSKWPVYGDFKVRYSKCK